MALHSSPQQAWVAEMFFVAISLGFVTIRTYIRIHHFRKLSLADVAAVFSWICLLSSALCDTCVKHLGLWDPKLDFKGGKEPDFPNLVPKEKLPDIVKGMKILYASVPIFYTGFFAVKFAFLLQYYDYFPPFRRRLRLALNSLCIVVLVGSIVSIVLNIFYCLPVERNWAMENDRKCFSSIQRLVYGFTNVFHIVTDFAIYILPFWLLPSLLGMRVSNLGSPLPHRRRNKQELYPVITIFSLGFLCILITMIRLICVGSSTSLSFFAAMSAAELAVAIAVSCSFTFKSGWDLFKSRRRRRKSSTQTTESRRPSRNDQIQNINKSRPNVRENYVGLEEARQQPVADSSSGGSESGSAALQEERNTNVGIESTVGRSYIDGIDDEEEGVAGPSLMARREVSDGDKIPERAQMRPAVLGTGKRSSFRKSSMNCNRSSLKAIQEKGGFALSNLTFGEHDNE